MAKTKQAKWGAFDDRNLADLQGIVGSIQSAKFLLETMSGNWDRIIRGDGEFDLEIITDLLSEAHANLAEVFECLEEQRDEDGDE